MNAWIDNLPGPKLASVVENQGDWMKERYHTDDVHFAIWLHALNSAVRRRVLVDFDDLEDWGYHDAYDADMTPKEAAIEMLEDTGYDFDEALS